MRETQVIVLQSFDPSLGGRTLPKQTGRFRVLAVRADAQWVAGPHADAPYAQVKFTYGGVADIHYSAMPVGADSTAQVFSWAIGTEGDAGVAVGTGTTQYVRPLPDIVLDESWTVTIEAGNAMTGDVIGSPTFLIEKLE